MGVGNDPIFLAVELFFAAIVLVVGFYTMTTLQGMAIIPTEVMTAIIDLFKGFDLLIALAFVLFSLVSIMLAYFIPSHPAFFFSYILVAIFAFIITPILSNAYAQIAAIPTTAAAFAAFPLTAWVIGNLPLLTFILTSILAVVSYGKSSTQVSTQQYGG
jgi:hypothetical protein